MRHAVYTHGRTALTAARSSDLTSLPLGGATVLPSQWGLLSDTRSLSRAHFHPPQWRSEGGGGGGMAPGRKPWRGRRAQLIGANFKKKIRPRQIIKVTSLQCRINLAAKVGICYGHRAFKGPALPMRVFLSFFLLMGGGGGGGAMQALAPGRWRPSLRH